MSKYDLLILDYGGVYSFEYDQASFNKIMLTVFGKVPTKEERIRVSLESRALGANKIDVTSYVKNVSAILNTEKIPENVLFEDTSISFAFPPTKVMSELVKKVKESGLKVSLLSDMYEFEIKKTKSQGKYEGFDYTSFAAESGMTKHDPLVFQVTLDF